MRTVANLCLLLVAFIFVSCSPKQFAFRKTYDVQSEQTIVHKHKAALQLSDTTAPVIENIVADPVLSSTVEKKTTATKEGVVVRTKQTKTGIRITHILTPAKQHVFNKPTETVSVQKPAFLLSLLALLLVLILLVLLAVWFAIALPILMVLLAVFLIVLIVLFLLGLLIGGF